MFQLCNHTTSPRRPNEFMIKFGRDEIFAVWRQVIFCIHMVNSAMLARTNLARDFPQSSILETSIHGMSVHSVLYISARNRMDPVMETRIEKNIISVFCPLKGYVYKRSITSDPIMGTGIGTVIGTNAQV